MKNKIGLFTLCFLVSSTVIAVPSSDNTKSEIKKTIAYTVNTQSNRQINRKSLANYSNLMQSNFKRRNFKKSNFIKDSQINEDTLKRLTAVASSSMSIFSQSGLASWYGKNLHGNKTASGELFNMHAMTAAHHTLTFGSYVKVTNKRNGKSVVVKINDRMPASNKRVIDISYAAAKKISMDSQGICNVTIERVNVPSRHTL